jgi:hypothetical protein
VTYALDLGEGNEVVFIADDIRTTGTGPHAKVKIGKRKFRVDAEGNRGDEIQSVLLDTDVFNLGRRQDRNQLSNSAWDTGFAVQNGHPPLLNKEELRNYLMRFCDEVPRVYAGLITPTYIIGDDTPISFIAKPHVVEDGGTIIFGPGGAGKSTALIVMALCIQYGIKAFWDVTQSNVLYVNVERGTPSIARRVAGIAPALGLGAEAELISLSERGRTLNELADNIHDTVQKHNIDIVLLDSLTRGGLGDLNDNKPANSFSDMMNLIAPTWVAIGHVSKRDNSNLFGSIMFENAADVMVKLTSSEGENKLGVRMDITKSNDAPRNVPPVWLKYEYDPITNGIIGVSHTNEREFPDLDGKVVKEGTVAEQIARYIQNETSDNTASAQEIADFLDKQRTNVSAVLNSNPIFVKVGKGRPQKYGLAPITV